MTSPKSYAATAVPDMPVPAAGAGPGQVGAIIPKFDTYAEQTFQRSGVPGMAIAIVKNDSVIYLRCFSHDPDGVMAGGLRNIERGAQDHPGDLIFFAN